MLKCITELQDSPCNLLFSCIVDNYTGLKLSYGRIAYCRNKMHINPSDSDNHLITKQREWDRNGQYSSR